MLWGRDTHIASAPLVLTGMQCGAIKFTCIVGSNHTVRELTPLVPGPLTNVQLVKDRKWAGWLKKQRPSDTDSQDHQGSSPTTAIGPNPGKTVRF